MASKIAILLAHVVIAVFGATVTALLWVAFIPPSEPMEFGPGTIIPPVVKAGAIVEIQREFTVLRPVTVEVNRYMREANCKMKCRIYDLQGSSRFYDEGKYEQKRLVVIPSYAKVGLYTFHVDVNYTSVIGRVYTQRSPTRTFEVVEK